MNSVLLSAVLCILVTLPCLKAFEDPRDVAIRAVDKVSAAELEHCLSFMEIGDPNMIQFKQIHQITGCPIWPENWVGLTYISDVPANSTKFASAQAESGRLWNNEIQSKPSPGLIPDGTRCT